LRSADQAAPGGAAFGVPADRPASVATSPAVAGGAINRDAYDNEVAAEGLRNVGNKSFFRRAADHRWVDSTVTEAMEKEARHVEQFSDEYFDLAQRHGKRLAQYLVFDEPVLLNLDGVAYFVDPSPMP
jgi:hypothetical protein